MVDWMIEFLHQRLIPYLFHWTTHQIRVLTPYFMKLLIVFNPFEAVAAHFYTAIFL